MSNVVLFIFAIAFVKVSSTNYRPGDKKMRIYGLFQSCSENGSISKNITRKADVCRQSVEWMDSNKIKINKEIIEFHRNTTRLTGRLTFPEHIKWNLDDIEYKTLKVCSATNLESSVINLLLDQENFVKMNGSGSNSENMWNDQKIYFGNEVIEYSRILALFFYADEKISTKAIQLLEQSQFPIYNLKFGWRPPESNSLHFKYKNLFEEFSVFGLFYERLTFLLRQKHVFYITLIFLESGNLRVDETYKKIRYHLERQSEFCFKAYEIQLAEAFNTTIRKIKSDSRLKIILTFGDPKRQVSLLNEALLQGLRNLSWVLQNVDEDFDFAFGIPQTTKVFTYTGNPFLFDYIKDRPYLRYVQNQSNKLEKGQGDEDIRYLCKMKTISVFNAYIFGLWKEIESRSMLWYNLFHQRFRLYVHKVLSLRRSFPLIMRGGKIIRTWPWSFRKKVLNSTCVIPICKIGAENRTFFNDSYYGQTCVQCLEDHYKSDIGNSKCKPCPKYTASTIKRDSCYDTYKEIFPSRDQWSVRIALFINGSGGVFSLFAIVIFLYRQDTPLVRAMDLKLSILHLVSLLMTFIITPWLFIGKPVTMICFVRPLYMSFTNNLNVAFVIAKSQRLLKIFKSKLTILSDGEMKRYNVYMGTGIFLICGLGQSFLFLPASKLKPTVIMVRMDDESVKDFYCNTEDYINIQLGYLILLQLFTALQAFRCRNLPGPFNEGMPIVYSTLLVIATYSVTFPIYYFQYMESMKSNVHFISLSVASLFPMLILYGKRLFIVVFKKSKNTKNYVRNRIWTFSSDTD